MSAAVRIPPELRAEFMEASRYAASSLLLAQGSGGNTSVKSREQGLLWVKASGLRMSDISEDAGYVEASLPDLLAVARDPVLGKRPAREAHEQSVRRFQAAVAAGQTLRPSLETGFHAVLGRVVLHTHSVYSNAFACMRDGRAALNAVLPDPTIWVPYVAPGYELGRAVDRASGSAGVERPVSIVLENHGYIASARTAREAIDMTEKIVAVSRSTFGELPADCTQTHSPADALAAWVAGLGEALRRRFAGAGCFVQPATLVGLAGLASDPERWCSVNALVPDDVVYGPSSILAAHAEESPTIWAERHLDGEPGKVAVIVAGVGVVLIAGSASLARSMEENLLANVLVRTLVGRCGVVRDLPREEVEYLKSMESEKYRQKIAGAR